MHSKYTNQQEETAQKEFEQTGSISATIPKLEYPSPTTLYRWYEHPKSRVEKLPWILRTIGKRYEHITFL